MRLIDANALSEELSSLTMTITGLRAGKGVLLEFMTEYRNSVLRIVDEAPTVEAVEVVRCKGCKHWQDSWVAPDGKHEHGYCHIEESDDVVVGRWDDDFCSYGERKDNDL